MRRVLVRTHGGLGNQIFQLFYARLLASQNRASLFEVHDANYAHGFLRSTELDRNPAPLICERAISAIRLPKILTRINISVSSFDFLGTRYLDGYFQYASDYEEFDKSSLRNELIKMRRELGVFGPKTREFGMHLRLGDFFTSELDLLAHLNNRLSQMKNNTIVVTNEENRLRSAQAADLLAKKQATVLSTRNMTPEQVLRILASFREVSGNDSTLLFWASVLSGMQCEFTNLDLRNLRERFLTALKD